MSNYTTSINNNYLAEYQSRKGKIMNKHNLEEKAKQIVRFKAKKHIDPNQWVSSNDIYKATLDKKRKSILVKTRRSKGNDYKLFVANNEVSIEGEDEDDSISEASLDDDIYFVFLGFGRWTAVWLG